MANNEATSISPELMPCPGCAENYTRVIGGPGTAGGPQYWAGCDHCNWRAWGNTEAEAITAWNTRTTPAEPVCEYCGGNGYSGGTTPAHDDLRGEYDVACEVCFGSGKVQRTPVADGEIERLRAEILRLVDALAYAHGNGFEWPSDPLPFGSMAHNLFIERGNDPERIAARAQLEEGNSNVAG